MTRLCCILCTRLMPVNEAVLVWTDDYGGRYVHNDPLECTEERRAAWKAARCAGKDEADA